MNEPRLGVVSGTAMYVGAILGAGLLVLPSLAAGVAGPASLLAWAMLLLISVPIAATFATLGARYPDGGGVATFTARAFGPRASAVVGYWFYFALPVGAPATALVGGRYIAGTVSGAGHGEGIIAGALLAAAFGANALGLRISGRIQTTLLGGLAALLVLSCAVALPHAQRDHLTPFLPHGYLSIGRAAGLLFFSFAGWEAVTHLSGEFRNPVRDLRRIATFTLIAITVLYFGLALTCVLVFGPRLATTPAPITALLRNGLGSAAGGVTAPLAAMLTFGTMNTFLAGGSRLGAALARDGALPSWLAKGGGPGEVPRRSLVLLAALATVVSLLNTLWGGDLSSLILATSSCFLAVTVSGLVAGVRLLPRGEPVWWGALVAAGVMSIVLLFTGAALVVPAGLALGAVLYASRHRDRLRTVQRKPSSPEPCSFESAGHGSEV